MTEAEFSVGLKDSKHQVHVPPWNNDSCSNLLLGEASRNNIGSEQGELPRKNQRLQSKDSKDSKQSKNASLDIDNDEMSLLLSENKLLESCLYNQPTRTDMVINSLHMSIGDNANFRREFEFVASKEVASSRNKPTESNVPVTKSRKNTPILNGVYRTEKLEKKQQHNHKSTTSVKEFISSEEKSSNSKRVPLSSGSKSFNSGSVTRTQQTLTKTKPKSPRRLKPEIELVNNRSTQQIQNLNSPSSKLNRSKKNIETSELSEFEFEEPDFQASSINEETTTPETNITRSKSNSRDSDDVPPKKRTSRKSLKIKATDLDKLPKSREEVKELLRKIKQQEKQLKKMLHETEGNDGELVTGVQTNSLGSSEVSESTISVSSSTSTATEKYPLIANPSTATIQSREKVKSIMRTKTKINESNTIEQKRPMPNIDETKTTIDETPKFDNCKNDTHADSDQDKNDSAGSMQFNDIFDFVEVDAKKTDDRHDGSGGGGGGNNSTVRANNSVPTLASKPTNASTIKMVKAGNSSSIIMAPFRVKPRPAGSSRLGHSMPDLDFESTMLKNRATDDGEEQRQQRPTRRPQRKQSPDTVENANQESYEYIDRNTVTSVESRSRNSKSSDGSDAKKRRKSEFDDRLGRSMPDLDFEPFFPKTDETTRRQQKPQRKNSFDITSSGEAKNSNDNNNNDHSTRKTEIDNLYGDWEGVMKANNVQPNDFFLQPSKQAMMQKQDEENTQRSTKQETPLTNRTSVRRTKSSEPLPTWSTHFNDPWKLKQVVAKPIITQSATVDNYSVRSELMKQLSSSFGTLANYEVNTDIKTESNTHVTKMVDRENAQTESDHTISTTNVSKGSSIATSSTNTSSTSPKRSIRSKSAPRQRASTSSSRDNETTVSRSRVSSSQTPQGNGDDNIVSKSRSKSTTRSKSTSRTRTSSTENTTTDESRSSRERSKSKSRTNSSSPVRRISREKVSSSEESRPKTPSRSTQRRSVGDVESSSNKERRPRDSRSKSRSRRSSNENEEKSSSKLSSGRTQRSSSRRRTPTTTTTTSGSNDSIPREEGNVPAPTSPTKRSKAVSHNNDDVRVRSRSKSRPKSKNITDEQEQSDNPPPLVGANLEGKPRRPGLQRSEGESRSRNGGLGSSTKSMKSMSLVSSPSSSPTSKRRSSVDSGQADGVSGDSREKQSSTTRSGSSRRKIERSDGTTTSNRNGGLGSSTRSITKRSPSSSPDAARRRDRADRDNCTSNDGTDVDVTKSVTKSSRSSKPSTSKSPEADDSSNAVKVRSLSNSPTNRRRGTLNSLRSIDSQTSTDRSSNANNTVSGASISRDKKERKSSTTRSLGVVKGSNDDIDKNVEIQKKEKLRTVRSSSSSPTARSGTLNSTSTASTGILTTNTDTFGEKCYDRPVGSKKPSTPEKVPVAKTPAKTITTKEKPRKQRSFSCSPVSQTQEFVDLKVAKNSVVASDGNGREKEVDENENSYEPMKKMRSPVTSPKGKVYQENIVGGIAAKVVKSPFVHMKKIATPAASTSTTSNERHHGQQEKMHKFKRSMSLSPTTGDDTVGENNHRRSSDSAMIDESCIISDELMIANGTPNISPSISGGKRYDTNDNNKRGSKTKTVTNKTATTNTIKSTTTTNVDNTAGRSQSRGRMDRNKQGT